MIVDLLRNDLGRVCVPGSVTVPSLWQVEPHPAVWQLVSSVEGTLAEDRDIFDLLVATFPGGSVTGAPKLRARQIIAELEPEARGPYCGCFGYISVTGHVNLAMTIRTLLLEEDVAYAPVGAGIVADSDPEAEYEETLLKARALGEAIGLEKPWTG
jgi:para-aminobenzoate synthetase component I